MKRKLFRRELLAGHGPGAGSEPCNRSLFLLAVNFKLHALLMQLFHLLERYKFCKDCCWSISCAKAGVLKLAENDLDYSGNSTSHVQYRRRLIEFVYRASRL